MTETDQREPLTRRQREYLDAISRFYEEHYRPPLLSELSARLGFTDPGTPFCVVQEMIRKGYLKRSPIRRGFDLNYDRKRTHIIKLQPGQSFEFGGVYFGLYYIKPEQNVVGLEVIGPEFFSEPKSEQGEILL